MRENDTEKINMETHADTVQESIGRWVRSFGMTDSERTWIADTEVVTHYSMFGNTDSEKTWSAYTEVVPCLGENTLPIAPLVRIETWADAVDTEDEDEFAGSRGQAIESFRLDHDDEHVMTVEVIDISEGYHAEPMEDVAIDVHREEAQEATPEIRTTL